MITSAAISDDRNLRDEEGHIDWLETHVVRIQKMGLQIWYASTDSRRRLSRVGEELGG